MAGAAVQMLERPVVMKLWQFAIRLLIVASAAGWAAAQTPPSLFDPARDRPPVVSGSLRVERSAAREEFTFR